MARPFTHRSIQAPRTRQRFGRAVPHWDVTADSEAFVQARRETFALTLTEAAERLGVSADVVTEIEQGGRSFDLTHALELLAAGGRGSR